MRIRCYNQNTRVVSEVAYTLLLRRRGRYRINADWVSDKKLKVVMAVEVVFLSKEIFYFFQVLPQIKFPLNFIDFFIYSLVDPERNFFVEERGDIIKKIIIII